MEYQEIKMTGKFWPQILSTKPVWAAGDESRLIYAEDTEKFYIGRSSDWDEMSMGDATTFMKNNANQTLAGDLDPTSNDAYTLGDATHKWLEITGTTFTGTVTTATYADLAEKYTTGVEYPVGTLLEVAYEEEFDLTSTDGISECFVGVVSEHPGFVMNQDSPGQIVGLVGKVPIRIIGPVYKRDFIVAGEDGIGYVDNDIDLNYRVAIALESNDDFGEKLVNCVL